MDEKLLAGINKPYERQWAGTSRFRSILALTHPTAVLVFAGAVLLLSGVTAGETSSLALLVCLTLSMGCAQAAIGVFNEVCDYDVDRVAKPWRALAAGNLALKNAKWLAFGFAAVACVLAWFVSIPCLLLLVLGLGAGFLYSSRLKRSIFSWLPYAIAYPLPVVWVWVSVDRFTPVLLLIYPIALFFAIGTHLCNQLRDFDEDQASGIWGLAQHLGKYRATQLCIWLLVFSPIPLLLLGVIDGWVMRWVLFIGLVYWALILPVMRNNIQGTGEMSRKLFRRLQVGGPLLLIGYLISSGIWQPVCARAMCLHP